MMERNERLKAADKCASRYTDKNEARIARSSFMLGCEFEAQGEAIKGVNLSTLESEKPMDQDGLKEEVKRYLQEEHDRDTTVGDVARHFAQWQKEQMVREAVEGWVAVDSDTSGKRRVTFFSRKPVRDVLTEYKYWAATRPGYESIKLDSNAFPELKWEDEPKKVHIIIVKE